MCLYTLPQKKLNFSEVAFVLEESVGQWTLSRKVLGILGWVFFKTFDKIDMTLGQGKKARATRENGRIKVCMFYIVAEFQIAKYFLSDEFISSLIFVKPQTGKAMHNRPLCMSIGGLKKQHIKYILSQPFYVILDSHSFALQSVICVYKNKLGSFNLKVNK